jgi:NADH/NAD ratio-sensing transcriptional regulator Rex
MRRAMEEMEMVELTETMERLSAAIEQLEETVRASSAAGAAFSAQAEETIGRIVATVESAREAELERKLAEAEAKIAVLSAAAAGGRKTVARMMAKESGEGVGGGRD